MINKILNKIASAQNLKKLVPKKIKVFGRRFLPYSEYTKKYWLALDEFRDIEEESTYEPKYDAVFGIIKEITRYHKYYIGACRELGVPYKILDISGPNWIDVIQKSGCDAFLVRPSAISSELKKMYDERLKIMVDELGLVIYPPFNEVWIYESKRKMQYWLESNDVSHPKTWIFYDLEKALEFGKQVELPIVYKSDLGTTACGVKIFRNRNFLLKHIRKCFGKGFVVRGGDPRDRQWGSIFLQEYLPDALEWRIICIDGSYFGHQKLKSGDFHSGSGQVGWYDPPDDLLNMVREIVSKGNFSSMCMDVFQTKDGRYLINELQSLFGSRTESQMYVDGVPGRYVYSDESNKWLFDEGIYCSNGSCDLRVKALLRLLGKI